jgi:metal-responsive CopG/Arc/MetJ family transcriptional regulator
MDADKKFKVVSVQLEPEVLEKVDAKATALDLNRSQYFRRLVKNDLAAEAVNTHPVDTAVAA